VDENFYAASVRDRLTSATEHQYVSALQNSQCEVVSAIYGLLHGTPGVGCGCVGQLRSTTRRCSSDAVRWSDEQHVGETWRFTAITEENKIAQFTCRGYSTSNTITKDHFYLVSNMSTTAHGDKLTVNIGPKSKVLHVAFPTAATLPLFVRN